VDTIVREIRFCAPSTRPNHSRIKRRQSIALVLWLTAPPLPRPAAPAVERHCLYGLMRQALTSGFRPSRSSRAASGRSGLLRLEPWWRDKGPLHRTQVIRAAIISASSRAVFFSFVIVGRADRAFKVQRLSDLEPRFVCTACEKRLADVRPDFNWDKKKPVGY
jgi:hypothetical protein